MCSSGSKIPTSSGGLLGVEVRPDDNVNTTGAAGHLIVGGAVHQAVHAINGRTLPL